MLNIKGAFNALLPSKILQQLTNNKVAARITNFIAFMTAKRYIKFQDGTEPRLCGVGVPQGGVFLPLLFNFTLKDIGKHLPPDVRIIQFADDILMCHRSTDINESLARLKY